MNLLSDPAAAQVVALVAGLLMTVAGVGVKRLRFGRVECPVCHHPRSSCTCRWL